MVSKRSTLNLIYRAFVETYGSNIFVLIRTSATWIILRPKKCLSWVSWRLLKCYVKDARGLFVALVVVLKSCRTLRSRHRYAKSIGIRIMFEYHRRPYYIGHRSRHVVGHGERVLFELRGRSKLVRNHCRCMYSWSCDIHIHVQFLFANLRYVQRCLFVQEASSTKIDAFKGTIVLV